MRHLNLEDVFHASQPVHLPRFANIPGAFNPARGTWQVVPFFHLLGSEENSSKAAPVQERIPAAYIALAKSEAAAWRGNLIGTLRMGVVPLSSFDPLPLLQRLNQDHPELRFELSALSSEQILEQLASNQLDVGVSYLDRLDHERFDSQALGETRMGLLYDQRHFNFGEQPLSWEALIELPLGLLSGGMHFRQSIDHNFHSRGLTPHPLLQTDAVHQLLQAVHGGFCCAVMPLEGGLQALTDDLRLHPIEDAKTLARLGLIMRREAPRSALAEACFALYQKSLNPS